MFGLLFVAVLHAAALYGLWSYRVIPTSDEALTLMVNFINPPPSPEKPESPKPKPPKPPEPRPPDPPPVEPPQLAVKAPEVQPEEPVVYTPPPPSAPVIDVPPLPPQPVVLSDELSVNCPERAPPAYPSLSTRLNEQGKVLLRVELGEDGRIANAEIKVSSGYRRLDDAALNTVRTWRCNPPMRNGVAARAVALQAFNFILGGR